MAGQQVREFNIRAAGADRSFQKFILGKFPLGPPELKRQGTSWRKSERECYVAKPDRHSTKEPDVRPASKQWVLDDSSGVAQQPVLVGQPEAGMGDGSGGGSSGYFLLVRHRGSEDFLTLPVNEWQNFKPLMKRHTNSLEEAEAEMKRKRLAAERVNPRLAQAVKAGGGEEGGIAVPGDDEEHDSDVEWKDIRARAATRQAIKAAPPQRRPAGTAGGGMDEEEVHEDEDHAEKSDKGEDWEHEDVAADDDLDMGEGEEDATADVSPVTRRRAGSASSDEEDNVAPAKVSRALKRMMRQTGLEDEDEESEGDEESESIEDDEEDLDKMATGLLPGRARSPSPGMQGAEEAVSKKRKAPTPPLAAAAAVAAAAAGAKPGAPAAAAAAAGGGDQQAKRQRTGSASAAAATPAARTGAPPLAGTGAVGASPVSAGEIGALLLKHGRMPLKDIAAHFKAMLRSPEERNAFTQLVKQIAKLEPSQSADGQKYLVLR